MRHPCSRPDCDQKAHIIFSSTGYSHQNYGKKGRCEKHGRWYACKEHEERGFAGCPVCKWETPYEQDRIEAARRNAITEARVERRLQEYMKVFRAQGYGETAARTMAEKRFSEEDERPRRWSDSDIRYERDEAEFRKKARAGEVMCCPKCKQRAPASDGIILKHMVIGGFDDPSYDCDGYGTPGEAFEFSEE
jgi:hypothetical protein